MKEQNPDDEKLLSVFISHKCCVVESVANFLKARHCELSPT